MWIHAMIDVGTGRHSGILGLGGVIKKLGLG